VANIVNLPLSAREPTRASRSCRPQNLGRGPRLSTWRESSHRSAVAALGKSRSILTHSCAKPSSWPKPGIDAYCSTVHWHNIMTWPALFIRSCPKRRIGRAAPRPRCHGAARPASRAGCSGQSTVSARHVIHSTLNPRLWMEMRKLHPMTRRALWHYVVGRPHQVLPRSPSPSSGSRG